MRDTGNRGVISSLAAHCPAHCLVQCTCSHQLARLLLYGCNLLKALAAVLSCIIELTEQVGVWPLLSKLVREITWVFVGRVHACMHAELLPEAFSR
jgi:hypothetical protein